jgi:hypothetical protein
MDVYSDFTLPAFGHHVTIFNRDGGGGKFLRNVGEVLLDITLLHHGI